MIDELLTGYRVLDLTDLQGYTCGRILAAHGAEVIKVEHPSGDKWRTISRSPAGSENLFWYINNVGKLGITLDLESDAGIVIYKQLVEKTDIVIETFHPGYLDKIGIGYTDLEKVNRGIILTSITPFGQNGPYNDYRGSELIASAMSGVLKTIGFPDRAPVKEAGDACIFHANAAASTAAMFALYERGVNGQGQHIDVSMQEVGAARNTVCLLSYQFDGLPHQRAGALFSNGALPPRRFTWELMDGLLCRSLDGRLGGGPSANPALSEWMDAEGVKNPLAVVDWTRQTQLSLSPEVTRELETAMDEFFRMHTKEETQTAIRDRGIGGTIVQEPYEILMDEHLRDRQFLGEHNMGAHENMELPNYFIRLSGMEALPPRPAPGLGEHNMEIFGELLGISGKKMQQLRDAKVIT
jgi:crotonobetainyl-CoA:carnitine CoA-transferase CaiB-like acyl-CoA transferase